MLAILMTGLNHSGKSYTAERIAQQCKNCVVVENDPFRTLIRKNESLNQLMEQTKKLYSGYEYPNLQGRYFTETVKFIAEHKHVPIIATVNGKLEQRKDLITRLKTIGYTQFGIIYCNPGLEVIRSRFEQVRKEKDPINYTRGISEENLQWMLSFFQAPTLDEADLLREITDDASMQQVIEEVRKLTLLHKTP